MAENPQRPVKSLLGSDAKAPVSNRGMRQIGPPVATAGPIFFQPR
jgi:hypothetical protein